MDVINNELSRYTVFASLKNEVVLVMNSNWNRVFLALAVSQVATICSIAKEGTTLNDQSLSGSTYLSLVAQKAMKVYFPLQGFGECQSSVCFKLDCNGKTADAKVDKHPFHWKTHATAPLADSALTFMVKNLELPSPPKDLGCPVFLRLVVDGTGKEPAKIRAQIIEPSASSAKLRKGADRFQHGTSP